MIKSAICQMLDIEYPVFQGGMAWIADGRLAAAVSDGGGLGIIAAGNAPGDYVRQQIRAARSITDKPIGVNIMLLSPFADDVANVVIEEKVEVVTTGAGNPSKYIRDWLSAGIKVIPVVASVAMAKLMTRLGASALIAEGGESGGHVGELTTMVLVPQICDATSLPVIAAGGIADGRGVAAAFMLGAQGVQMGTRLWGPVCSVPMSAVSTLFIKKRSLRPLISVPWSPASGWGIPSAVSERRLPENIPKLNTAVCRMTSWKGWQRGHCGLQCRKGTPKGAVSFPVRSQPWSKKNSLRQK